MTTIRNVAKEKLDAGELAIGVGLRQARTVDIGKAMRTAGFDWLFIDMEHNSMAIDTAVQISVAAQDAGITPIVRVPGFQHFHATRVLDGGAQGIVVPHVDDVETAKRMVENCKYPPLGHRSVTGSLPQLDFRSVSMAESVEAVNSSTLLILMLESPQAIENVDAIAAVPGVDAVLIGTSDLCMELGIPGQPDHPKVVDAYERTAAACRAHGKHMGMGGVYEPELMRGYVEIGARLVLAGSDMSFLMAGAKAQAAATRSMLS
ncbi:MAG: aldolase [Rhodospirillaceae bacterium]|nr:aldolase [Rhodospirillaceae bacterium]MBT6138822.1 aldolase [Rhodospirillaceae bacterium]